MHILNLDLKSSFHGSHVAFFLVLSKFEGKICDDRLLEENRRKGLLFACWSGGERMNERKREAEEQNLTIMVLLSSMSLIFSDEHSVVTFIRFQSKLFTRTEHLVEERKRKRTTRATLKSVIHSDTITLKFLFI